MECCEFRLFGSELWLGAARLKPKKSGSFENGLFMYL
jgi:hypothetical protein